MLVWDFAEQYQKLQLFVAKSPFPCPYFGSWEQLWLAYVMHELYDKVWDDKKEEWL